MYGLDHAALGGGAYAGTSLAADKNLGLTQANYVFSNKSSWTRAKYNTLTPESDPAIGAGILLTLGVAYLSYQFIKGTR